MAGELSLSRQRLDTGRSPTAVAPKPRAPALAQRSAIGVATFMLLVIFCLYDLNTVGYQIFGVLQLFSYVILALCAILLLVYRFTVYRDVGPVGRVYFLFLAAYIAIGFPIGLAHDAAGLDARAHEVRLVLASGLIVAAAAVGSRSILLAYGLRNTMRLLFAMAVLLPALIWISWHFPEFYRVEVGKARDFSRATGTFANPNEAAAAVCIVSALFFAHMLVEKSKLFSTAALAVAAVAVYLTASRAGIIIFLGLALAQAVVTPGLKRIMPLLVGGAIAASVVFAAYKFVASGNATDRSLVSRMETLLLVMKGDVSDETTGGRFQLAMGGIKAWMNSPLLGNGLGTQRRIDAVTLGPHNNYIRIGGEAGVIPLVLFCVLLATWLRYSWNCHVPAVRTFSAGVALVTAAVCLVSHDVISSREMAVVFGICFGLMSGCLEQRTAVEASRRRLAAVRAAQSLRMRTALGPRPGLS